MCVYMNNLISEITVFMLIIALIIYSCKNAQVNCYNSIHKLSTSCVHTACSQLLYNVWNKAVNKLDGIIRLVTSLF